MAAWWRRGWVKHYLPLWLVLILLPIPWIAAFIEDPSEQRPTTQASGSLLRRCRPNYYADVAFALMGFWIWAATTNAHSNHSVRSSGQKRFALSKPGDQKARREEFLRILLFGILTGIAYFACVVPALRWLGGLMVFIGCVFPLLVLRVPTS